MAIRASGDQGLPFEVVRSRRRSIGVTVHEDGRIEVRAPRGVSQRQIQQTVRENHEWIVRTRAKHMERTQHVRERRFDDGDTVPYRGGRLVLRVREAPGTPASPPIRRADELHVEVPGALGLPERRRVAREAVGRWLLAEAQRVFHERHLAAAERVGLRARSLTIKHMTTRWGSCGREGRMSLDWRLVMAPPHVLDYVLVHELVHIEVHDHSRRFWARVATACRHYRRSRRWLSEHASGLAL